MKRADTRYYRNSSSSRARCQRQLAVHESCVKGQRSHWDAEDAPDAGAIECKWIVGGFARLLKLAFTSATLRGASLGGVCHRAKIVPAVNRCASHRML